MLEFIDLGGEMRRDVWYSFINEVIALYKFISEYGPKDGDQSVNDIYGAHRGNNRAVAHAINAIARLQALQFMRRTLDEPTKLVPFSYLRNTPYGDVVLQTLAVNFWGGPIVKKLAEFDNELDERVGPNGGETPQSSSSHVFDVDGSVYLRKWMRSSTSWGSNASLAFWRNNSTSVKQRVVLSKNLVVADLNLVERASITCRDKYRVAEKTQATIDAAMIEGIPSNIDLFKVRIHCFSFLILVIFWIFLVFNSLFDVKEDMPFFLCHFIVFLHGFTPLILSYAILVIITQSSMTIYALSLSLTHPHPPSISF